MTAKSSNTKKPAAQVVKDIRRATRRNFSSEAKIRIVLDGLRGEDSIAELCRKEGIAQSLYTWSKAFMEAGKRAAWLEVPHQRRELVDSDLYPGNSHSGGASGRTSPLDHGPGGGKVGQKKQR